MNVPENILNNKITIIWIDGNGCVHIGGHAAIGMPPGTATNHSVPDKRLHHSTLHPSKWSKSQRYWYQR